MIVNRYVEQFIKKHPATYQLYLRGRKLLAPYMSEEDLDDMGMEYIGGECGIFFYQLLFYADKEHFLDKFTPSEMYIIAYWVCFSSLNTEDQLNGYIDRIIDEYCRITGNQLDENTPIPQELQ